MRGMSTYLDFMASLTQGYACTKACNTSTNGDDFERHVLKWSIEEVVEELCARRESFLSGG